MHEVDVIYRMRERLEPIALAVSLPQLVQEDLDRLEEIQQQIEQNTDLDRFLELDRTFHLARTPAARSTRLTRSSPDCGTRPSTTAARSSRSVARAACGS